MRARYIGQECQTDAFGEIFHQSTWVSIDVLNDYARGALSQNPQFETGDGEAVDTDGPTLIDPVDPVV